MLSYAFVVMKNNFDNLHEIIMTIKFELIYHSFTCYCHGLDIKYRLALWFLIIIIIIITMIMMFDSLLWRWRRILEHRDIPVVSHSDCRLGMLGSQLKRVKGENT